MAVADVDAVTFVTFVGVSNVVVVVISVFEGSVAVISVAVASAVVVGVAVTAADVEIDVLAVDVLTSLAVVVSVIVDAVSAAVDVICESFSSGGRATSLASAVGAPVLGADPDAVVDCSFFGKRGDFCGVRLPASLVGATGLLVTVGFLATAGLVGAIVLAGGFERLGVFGDTFDSGALDGTGLRGDDLFLRGGILSGHTVVVAGGTGGGLPAVVVGWSTVSRSFVDADNRCLISGRRGRPVLIRGSDDCRLSGSEVGLDARDRPFLGVLKP